jgi:diphthine synthase
LKGLEKIRKCEKVYLESYTSILGVDKAKLEKLYQKEVIEADRDTCELEMDNILVELSMSKDEK